MRRMIVRVLVVLAMLGLGTAVAATPAQASVNQCTAGRVCVWEHLGYTGCFRGMTLDASDYTDIAWATCSGNLDNKATSVRNEGTACNVRMYQHGGRQGASIFLFRQGNGTPFTDPDLSNGITNNPAPFNDTISSHLFCP